MITVSDSADWPAGHASRARAFAAPSAPRIHGTSTAVERRGPHRQRRMPSGSLRRHGRRRREAPAASGSGYRDGR